MKKFFKIFGIVIAGIIGLIAIAFAVAAITGAFSQKKINIEQLSWEEDNMVVVDDFKATINFLPENANQLDVELKFVYEDGANIVEIPQTVKAGEEFTIKVKKDGKGKNIGGEVVISAQTSLVKTQTNLKILVDVPIPSDGLLIASDYDTEDDENIINAGSSEFNLYVYTNPNLALNPNTGKELDLTKAYKNITLTSGDTEVLQILNNGVGSQKEMFYCPHYMESIPAQGNTPGHDPHAPFTDSRTCSYCNTDKSKVIVYGARATSSSQAPIIVTAKALRTYSMEEKYVDINDPKYLGEGGVIDADGRREFFEDLSAYVDEFKNFIIADPRPYVNATNNETIYANGKAFIDSVTQTNSSGETYVKINDNGTEYNATLFYLFVEARKVFNVKEIDIAEIDSTLNEKVEFDLHGDVQQFTVDDLINTFGIRLIPTNTDDFTSDDLKYRIRELKIIAIKDKVDGSESQFDFDYCGNIFEIENPASTVNAVWRIRAINPTSSTDKNVRLRFYIPRNANGEYTSGDLYCDVGVEVYENKVNEFSLISSGENAIATKMILNTQDTNGYSYRQVLDETRYVLTGADGQAPTYHTVKFFVTKDSAKTKLNGAETTYFKVKLNPADSNTAPALLTMPYNSTSVEAYEIAYTIAGKTYLEALNVTDGNNLRIFAAVIKTDHNGNPVDANGVSMGQEGYTGNYVVIAKSNEIEISIDNYLEKLNFYTIDKEENPTTFTLRNVPETGESQTTDTVQLLAYQSYKIIASPYLLNTTGEFDTANAAYANTEIDYKTNLTWAMNYAASTNNLIEFRTSSTDIEVSQTVYNVQKNYYEITIAAEIDKTASFGHVTEAFDFRAYGKDQIANTFSSSRSTVNMIVNYAKIDSFDLATTTNTNGSNRDYYVLSPTIESLTGEGGSVIKWRDQANAAIDFNILHNYELDIQKTEIGEDGGVKYNSKIDKSFANDEYVTNYINLITNPENTDAFKIDWRLELDRTQSGEQIPANAKVEDYIIISEETYEDNGVKKSRPVLTIKKGTEDGVFIKATCTLSIYKTNNGFIDSKQATINLVLKQSQVTFENYSPKKVETVDALIKNKPGPNDAFIMEGGGTDGRLGADSQPLEGYDLLKDYGSSNSKLPVYERGPGSVGGNDYVAVTNPDGSQKTAYKLINAIWGDDGELAGFCTYSISNNDASKIYFKDAEGNKIYTTTPNMVKKNNKTFFELVVYAEYLSTSQPAVITITSPFGDTQGTFNVYVNSSIVLTGPQGDKNITTKTTDDNGGVIDLTDYYGASRNSEQLKVGFEITEGGTFATLDGTTGTETINLVGGGQKTLRTILIPHNVYISKPVNLKMYYYLPQENEDGEVEYIENEVTQINNKNLAVSIERGYEITVNSNIQSLTNSPISINSGEGASNNGYNFFQVYSKNPDEFIQIRNLKTNTYVTDADEVLSLLKSLISLSFDEDNISAGDKSIFDSLFASSTNKNAIENGILNTQSISNNITIPIIINFKEGALTQDDDGANYSLSKLATFYCEVKASVVFSVIGQIEGVDYNKTQIIVDGQPVSNTLVGHTYKNFNIDTNSDGFIELNDYKTTLFNIGSNSNILQLKGTDGQELLSSRYLNYVLYKFNSANLNYQDVTSSDDNVEIKEVKDDSGLTNLSLIIKNSVNETSYYKLAIKTSINKENEYYEYYFTIKPTYQLKTNYPLVEGPENVTPGAQIDLLTNFINTLNRIQFYSVDELGQTHYYTISLDDVTGRYKLTTDQEDLNKEFSLEENEKPVNFEIVSGSAANVIGDKIMFTEPTNSNEEIVVKVTLFNGASINYEFNLYKSLNPIEITVADNAVEYAGNIINLLDETKKYVNVSSYPDNFKYVIKYKSYDSVKARLVTSEGTKLELDDPNEIIDYAQNGELLVEFDDVNTETTVEFYVWHNYFVHGQNGKVLRIKLLPNLKITENTNIQTLVAGISTDIITTTDNSWLKIENLTSDEMDNLTVEVSKVDNNEYDSKTNTLGIVITPDTSSLKYTFTSKNIGVNRTITLKVTKTVKDSTNPSETLYSYFYEFDITLVPNIKLNSAYTSTASYSLVAAASSDANGREVILNNEPNLFNPTDYNGNQLIIDNNGTANNGGVTLKAVICDASGSEIGTSNPNDGVRGLALTNSTLTLTVDVVNTPKDVRIKVTATWKNSVEPFEQIIRISINENIIASNDAVNQHRVQYSNGNSLTVFAGSKIELDFSKELVLSQNGNSATVIARQNNANGQKVNANIVFNKNVAESEYYDLIEESGKYYIFFKGVPSTQQITVPYYYDLTGKLHGLETNSDISQPDAIYNPNLSINITIQPSVGEVFYKNESHNTSETAIDITAQFASIFTDDYKNGKQLGENQLWSDAFVKDYDSSRPLDINQFNILDLFSFNPVNGVTFDEQSGTGVYVNIESLYSSFTYNVTGKRGDILKDMSTWTELDHITSYYTIDKSTGIVTFIPPAQSAGDNTVELTFTLTLPGVSGTSASQTVVFRLQFAGKYNEPKNDGTDEKYSYTIGSGGDIIDTYKFVNPDPNQGGNTTSTTYGINLNTTTSVDLDNKFFFGYLLATETGDGQNEEIYQENKHVQIVRRSAEGDNTRYYFYRFSNIKLEYSLAANSTQYAEINTETNELIPKVYYEQGSTAIRQISLTVTAGSISKDYTISIYPKTVTHEFSYDSSSKQFTNTLKSNSAEVDVYENKIELLQGGLSAEDYELYKTWLTSEVKDGKVVYSFKPDLNMLKQETTLQFVNTIYVDELQTQIFSKTIEVKLTPTVGLVYNKTNGVDANLSDTAVAITVVANGTNSLFNSKVFDSSTVTNLKLTNVSVKLSQTRTDVDYNKYVTLSVNADNADASDEAKVYTILSDTVLNVLPNQILVDVSLPYSIQVQFKINNTNYVLTENFNLIINANAGLTNLKDSYDVAVQKDSSNYLNSAIIDLTSGTDAVEKIGDGTIQFVVQDGISVDGSIGSATNVQLNTWITFSLDSSGNIVRSIQINWGLLIENTDVTRLNKITVDVYYTQIVDDKESNVKIKTITINFLYQ